MSQAKQKVVEMESLIPNPTEDLSYDTKDLNAIAMFVPSLGPNYIGYVSNYAKRYEGFPHRKPVKGLDPDGKELDFLKPDNGNFYWPYALYSAGHANLNIDKIGLDDKEAFLRKRDKSKTTIIGDSGGYQIGKGVLNFDWQNFESEENNKLRLKIMRWLESTADYSMTLDTPTWGIGNPRCGLKDFDDCLAKTKFNNDFFVKHRKEGATKFLNVLQGRNMDEGDIWWEGVKEYPFEGWAFAGVNASDFEIILRRLIIMRDGGYLNKNQNWAHFLGVSRLTSGCILTAIQREIRKTIEPTFSISFDASSPFYSASKGRMYTNLTYNSKKLNYTMDQVIDTKELVGSQLRFPLLSPIGKKLTLGDLCVKGKDLDTKSSWDSYSYMYIMNHNLYMHAKGIVEVNRFYDLPHPIIKEYIPKNLIQFKELVPEIFASENPFDLIESHTNLLKAITGLKMDSRKINQFQVSSYFQEENDNANLTGEDESSPQGFNDMVIEQ